VRVKSRCLYVIAVDELGIDGVLAEHLLATCHQELLAGTRHSNVQLAVDGVPVLNEAVGGQEIEVCLILHAKGIDDDVALRALIAFYSVDADIEQHGKIELSYLATLHRPPAQREKRGTVIHSVFQY